MGSSEGNSVLSCESIKNSIKPTTKLLAVSSNSPDNIPNFNVGEFNFNLPQPPSVVPMGPGLYVIHCLFNNKYYIGQSTNAAYRLGRHYENLRANKSDSKELQEDWNKYGASNFQFIVLASGPPYSDEKTRLKIEKSLISLNSNSIYNVAIASHHGRKARIRWKGTVYESIAAASRASKISETQIGRLADNPSVTEWERIPDDPFDDSLVLNSESSKRISIDGITYRSIKNAAEQLPISRRTISRRLENPDFPTYQYID